MKDGADAAKPVPRAPEPTLVPGPEPSPEPSLVPTPEPSPEPTPQPAPEDAGIGAAHAPPEVAPQAAARVSAAPPANASAAPASPAPAGAGKPPRPSGAGTTVAPRPWPPRVSSVLALSPPTPRLALAPPATRALSAPSSARPTQPPSPAADAPLAPAPPIAALATGMADSATPATAPLAPEPTCRVAPVAPVRPAAERQRSATAPSPSAAPSRPPPAARPRPSQLNPTWPAVPPSPPGARAPLPAPQPRSLSTARMPGEEGVKAGQRPDVSPGLAPGAPMPAPPRQAPQAPPAMLPPAEATPARPPPRERLPELGAKTPDAAPRRLTIVTPTVPRAHPEPQLRSAPALPPELETAPPSPVSPAALGSTAAPTSTLDGSAEPLLRPLPVPVFQPEPPREPAAAALPVWQEAPARRPPPWMPADGFGTELGTIFKRAVKWSALAGLALLLGLASLIVLYRWLNPPTSMLMLAQRLGGTTITRHWQPLEHVSSNLQLAVIVSEDGRFCRHHGVDWEELESAIDQSVDGFARGGSTIAMQTVKNLFLWPAKSYLRKAIEIPLAYAVDASWGKRRLLEIYLNIAEWGPGVFGAEAAARYHFHKPAALLTPREAALLAVSLPNPFERRAGAPGPGTQRLAANLMLRMRAAPGMARCVRSGSGL